MNTQQEPPKIEFPCDDYPVKIMGDAGSHYYEFAIEVVEQYAPKFDRSKISVRESRNGTFQSITVFITATGIEQLKGLHTSLRENPKTKMVL